MKLQKSIITLAIAATLSASVFTLPALAADNTQASTQFTYTKQNDPTYTKQNDPTYTVSIPSSLSLTDEGTPLTITASDVAYLNGKKVSVTIAGTNYYRNQLVLSAKTSKPTYTDTIRYQLIGPSNNVIETTGQNTATGTELASFTDNGTVTYTAKPVIGSKGQNLEPGVNYTGTMTFGIGLVE